MRDLLFELFIVVALIALGAVGGYLLHQEQTLSRYQKVITSTPFEFGVEELHYVATGDTLTFKK
jgi:hypothetical protein